MILVFFFFPTRPPDPRVFFPCTQPAPYTHPVSCVYRYYYYYSYFFPCSLSLSLSLASLANEFNPISPIENRRSSNLLSFFLSFFFPSPSSSETTTYFSFSRLARATMFSFLFFSFLFFPFESSPRAGDSRPRDKNFEPRICSFVRSFVYSYESIDRSIGRPISGSGDGKYR